MDAYEQIEWKESMYESEELSEEDFEDSYLNKYLDGNFSPKKDCIAIEKDFKERAKPNQLAKVPGSQFKFAYAKTSRFNKKEHAAFISALKVLTSGRRNINYYEKKDIETYNNSKSQIAIENKEFLSLAETDWKNNFGKKPLRIKPMIKLYATRRRLQKVMRVTDKPAYYKAVNLLPFSCEDEMPIEMIHTANVLDVGKVAKFLPPTLKEQFMLKDATLPESECSTTLSSRLPVSEDENINRMLENHKVDVVITFSALKRLMNFSDHTQKWDLPVVIKEIPHRDSKGEEKIERVVYIEKPLPDLQPTLLHLNENCRKLMLKTNLCCVEAFTYESTDIVVLPSDLNDADPEGVKEAGGEKKASHALILNRFYKLWNLKPKEDDSSCLLKRRIKREFGVLIRGKVDGSEINENGTLQAITVIPKMEHQLPFGGSVFTKKELAIQWTQLYFKPYSNLYRVRVNNHSGEVITIEPTNIEKVKMEAQTLYNYKPQSGIGVLHKLLSELTKYSPGKYLMKYEPKHGAFIALYQEVTDEESSDYNLHKTYQTEGKIVEDYIKPWTPIDPMILLPKYEFDGHMPGLFKPKPAPVKRKLDPKLLKTLRNQRKSKRKKAKAAAKRLLELEAAKSEY